MKILAIIPARGGSKGVPGKNIKLLGGKPLIVHAIDCALASKKVSKTIVTTDSDDIINVVRKYNVEIVKRPSNLATDNSNVISAVQHALNILNERFDIIVLLQPTSPLRTTKELDEIIELLIQNEKMEGVLSVIPIEDTHPARMYNIENENILKPFIENEEHLLRQELNKVYLRNGCFYAVRTQAFLKQNTFMVQNKLAFIMDLEWSVNIDTPRDFKLASLLYEEWKNEITNN